MNAGQTMNGEKNDAARLRAVGSVASDRMSGQQAEKASPKAKAPAAQDRWFDTQLSRMYADLAAEPLPKEMMTLLEKLKKQKS
jgi:hypothetical protein